MNSKVSFSKLRAAIEHFDSILCVGLDPDPSRFPQDIRDRYANVTDQAVAFIAGVIQAVAPHACAFKAQKAFFDAIPEGRKVLAYTITTVRQIAPGRPIFIDCKIGDIENTMTAYIKMLFDDLDADGVVVIPYLGTDVFHPFKKLPERTGLVVVRSSNSGASAIQDLTAADGRPLWQHVLQFVAESNYRKNLIPILSADAFCETNDLGRMWPLGEPILLAGFGAQGGALLPTLNARQFTVFANSSRSILYPNQQIEGCDWSGNIQAAAVSAKLALNTWRQAPLAHPAAI